MLTHSKEGKLCLEDQEGSVELDFSQLVSKFVVLLVTFPRLNPVLGPAKRRSVYGRVPRSH